jgi:phosphoglycolate phosphatase-like HAD superfamily hydrolase
MTLALDLDGTLISCKPRQSAVLRAALVAGRQTADVDAVWELKRAGASTTLALQACGLPLLAATSVSDYWQTWVEEPCWLSLDVVLDGVDATLASWCDSGLDLMLLTARSRPEWVAMQLRHLDLSGFFSRVESVPPTSAVESKARILRNSGAHAFVGDTESDARAAQAAGVRFIGVATGQRSAEFLRRVGVVNLASALAEVRF